MTRYWIGAWGLALFAACGSDTNDEPVGVAQPSLRGQRVTKVSVTLQARGDAADVYGIQPPARLRSLYRDRFAVVVFLQGGLVPRDAYESLARQVAAQGFIVVVPDRLQPFAPGTPPVPFPDQFVLNDALAELATLDQDPTSPFYEIVDTSRSAVAGHSLGGFVGLLNVEGSCLPPFCFGFYQRPASLRGAVFYGTNTVQEDGTVLDVDTTDIPTALIQGALDTRAFPAEAQQTFDQVLDGTKAFITIEGVNHFGLTDEQVIPGAIPDTNPQTVDQATSIRRIARWTGLALRAFVNDDRFAERLIFDVRGRFNRNITIQADRGAP